LSIVFGVIVSKNQTWVAYVVPFTYKAIDQNSLTLNKIRLQIPLQPQVKSPITAKTLIRPLFPDDNTILLYLRKKFSILQLHHSNYVAISKKEKFL